MIDLKSKENQSINQSFEQQWNKYHQDIKACCYQWLRPRVELVDDALSMTMEKAYWHYFYKKNIQALKLSWLKKVAYHICMDFHRNIKKELKLIDDVSNVAETLYFIEQSGDLLEESLQFQQELEQLKLMVEQLPNSMRKVMQCLLYYDMAYGEIADRCNLSNSNVRKLVQLARKRLKQRGIFCR